MDLKRFGIELAQMRKWLGFTQEGLVDELHRLRYCSATHNYIARIEIGVRKPTEEQLRALLRFFVNEGLLRSSRQAISWVGLVERAPSRGELEDLFGVQATAEGVLSQSVWSVPQPPRYYVVPKGATDRLEAAVMQDDGHGQWPILITGMAGVGKTTLLQAFAHSPTTRIHFNYALWAELSKEKPPHYWQEQWGDILGVDLTASTDVPHRRRILEKSLEDKAALLLIDDVWEAEDVVPLLVGGPACRTVISTREELEVSAALTLGSCERVHVKPLGIKGGLALVTKYLGTLSSREEEDYVVEMVHLVEGLPMALEILAALIHITGDWQEILNDVRSPDYLPTVPSSSERHNAYGAFYAGYKRLDEKQQKCFRLLGALAVAATFDSETASVLWSSNESDTKSVLLAFQGRHLVNRDSDRRYRLHRLLHRFAGELVSDEEREASHRILVTHFGQRLQAYSAQFTMSGPEAVAPGLAGAERDWTQAQALFREAAEREDWDAMYKMMMVNANYLAQREEWAVLDKWCKVIASGSGDRKGSEWADVMRNWRLALQALGRYEEVILRFEEALAWARDDIDRLEIYVGLAETYLRMNDGKTTRAYLLKAEPLAKQYPVYYPRYQRARGLWESFCGDPVRALRDLELAEVGFRSLGANMGATSRLEERAEAHLHIGDVNQSVALYKQAAMERAHYGQKRDQLRCLIRIAETLLKLRDRDALRELYNDELFELWEQLPDERKDAQWWAHMGFLAEGVEDIAGCRRSWSKALTLSGLSEQQKAEIRLRWAYVEADDGDLEKARELLAEAASHFIRVNDEDAMADVRRLQSRLGVA